MRVPRTAAWVMVYQGMGFGLIALLSAFNHLRHLPDLFAGGGAGFWHQYCEVVETVVIFLIWAFAFLVTRRLLLRLRQLEGMLRVCAWCRKIGHDNKWMGLEDYFAEGFQVGTTHGICPECLKKVEEDTARFCQLERQAATTPLPPQQNPDQPQLAA